MDATEPRFEFRVFGASLGMAEQRMRDTAPCESISESREIYLLGRGIDAGTNLKVRHGRLELKRLIEHHQGLQRWQPAGQWAFPVAPDTIEGILNPGYTLGQGRDPAALLSLDDLPRFTTETAGQLVLAHVFKRRFRYTLPACHAEFDQLLVNGAAIESIAIESVDPQAILASRSAMRLEDLENQSYPLALSRILGLRSPPHADEYG
ncbi:MAG: hypothetical protein PVG72_06650 [Gammaproteobacteria bacterium]|jgi:hypothetical protein